MRVVSSGLVALLAAGTLFVAGCSEEKKPAPAANTKAAAGAADVSDKELEDVEITDDDIQTAADFEDDAEKTISADNLESELDALEAEIGG